MKLLSKIVICASLFMIMQISAFALTSDSLRCAGGIISKGDVASEVVRKCGEPAYAAQREQKIVEDGWSTGERLVTIVILDDWTFNFGPGQFQYRVLLKNGKVSQIESLGYGY